MGWGGGGVRGEGVRGVVVLLGEGQRGEKGISVIAPITTTTRLKLPVVPGSGRTSVCICFCVCKSACAVNNLVLR